jgi:two-component system, chemotaxis family, protein-glutamate methylesterase/glutaminase
MPERDIVVMGASAGGVEALRETVRGLRPDIRASFFIVLHFPPFQKSHLPGILSRVGPLPAVHPNNGDVIQLRHIYVAPPDRHLLVRDGRIELWRGPKENYTRPAINPLFKSAAETYGPRVIGVILTGLLDDGTAGLIEIKRRGGIGVVQDPDEAMFSSMPISALKRDHVDYSVKLSEMAKLLSTLIRDSEFRQIAGGSMNPGDRYTPTDLTCPECRGPLSERQDGALTELRCRVGHIYSLESVTAAHVETQERTLWSAVVTLEEGAELFRKTAAQSEGSQSGRLINQAKTREANAKLIREMLEGLNEEVL